MTREERSAQLRKLSDEELYSMAKKAWYEEPEDADTAFLTASILEERGHAGALQILGEIYYLGRGAQKDLGLAQYYFTRGAVRGIENCQVWLGDLYTLSAAERNLPLAEFWFQKAARQNISYAFLRLGNLYEHEDWDGYDAQKALDFYLKGAELGNAKCQYNAGYNYAYGYGVAQDAEKGVRLFRAAAEQGNQDAQNELGCCLIKGIGVKADDTEAFSWIKKAAYQGHRSGMYNLAQFYEKGICVNADAEEALSWYRRAAAKGHEKAAAAIKRLEGRNE